MRRSVPSAGTLAVALLALMVPGAWAASGDTTRVSGACPADALPADLDAISGDGRFVAVECGFADKLYVHDAVSGQTVLASRATGANGAAGSVFSASISADGRFVAFDSDDTNLAPGLVAGFSHVFVRDLRRHTTTVIGGARRGAKGCGHANDPSISADGRFVAFAGGRLSCNSYQVVVRDLLTNKDTLASRANGARGAIGNGGFGSVSPSISADGRRVAFESDATNLVVGDHNHRSDVFVRDLRAHTTTLVSRASGARGAKGDHASDSALISANGRSVAFDSEADNLGPGRSRGDGVYIRKLRARTTTPVGTAVGPDFVSSVSGDGQRVALESIPSDSASDENVFVSDIAARTTTLINRASGPDGPIGNAWSKDGLLSADGRRVAFLSGATNLTPDDANAGVFVREL